MTTIKGFIKDWQGLTLLPITRAELVLDKYGNAAFRSSDFLADASNNGLMPAGYTTIIENLDDKYITEIKPANNTITVSGINIAVNTNVIATQDYVNGEINRLQELINAASTGALVFGGTVSGDESSSESADIYLRGETTPVPTDLENTYHIVSETFTVSKNVTHDKKDARVSPGDTVIINENGDVYIVPSGDDFITVYDRFNESHVGNSIQFKLCDVEESGLTIVVLPLDYRYKPSDQGDSGILFTSGYGDGYYLKGDGIITHSYDNSTDTITFGLDKDKLDIPTSITVANKYKWNDENNAIVDKEYSLGSEYLFNDTDGLKLRIGSIRSVSGGVKINQGLMDITTFNDYWGVTAKLEEIKNSLNDTVESTDTTTYAYGSKALKNAVTITI